MDARAAKLALARQKLKSHQEKKLISIHRDETEQQQNDILHAEVTVGLYECDKPADENRNENLNDFSQTKSDHNHQNICKADVNVTEILISSKRNLELQVNELQKRFSQLENNYALAINDNSYCKQQLSSLEYELKTLQDRYLKASNDINVQEKIISDLNNVKSKILDENNNLQEQLEFTKSMLNEKESENSALHNQVNNLQSQVDAMQLQLQQITSGSQGQGLAGASQNKPGNPDQNPEVLLQKISLLEKQLKSIQKERDQINCHYEQYVGELNEQLKLTVTKNNELSIQVQNLLMRENSLIEQISDMEIRIQNMRQQQQPIESHQLVNQDVQAKFDAEINTLQQKNENIQQQLQEAFRQYEELQVKYAESEAKIQDLIQSKESECEHDNISISKLSADITSDKLAAQRATEQNKKMKIDLQELEEAFIKISRDKLELTEKVAAEKFLNRELTIKLADSEEKAKDVLVKLRAKDEEMIRLQNSYRELEKKLKNICNDRKFEEVNSLSETGENEINNKHENCTHQTVEIYPHVCEQSHRIEEEHQCLIEDKAGDSNDSKIPKEDAMVKLQDRFLKIMDEVANLSDEKHRLEHIILQLQNETDTICEYVALYQQQRSLLKKRDEERSAQIKIFQAECELLKSQLEELSGIIIRLAKDTELAVYFQTEPRQSDLAKVMNLLSNLKSNTLIDPHKTSSELKDFYPCSCCSGQLIEV